MPECIKEIGLELVEEQLPRTKYVLRILKEEALEEMQKVAFGPIEVGRGFYVFVRGRYWAFKIKYIEPRGAIRACWNTQIRLVI